MLRNRDAKSKNLLLQLARLIASVHISSIACNRYIISLLVASKSKKFVRYQQLYAAMYQALDTVLLKMEQCQEKLSSDYMLLQ